jgi:hypothetical protein
MGGYGSGRSGGRPTVESALRLDIDKLMGWGAIRAGEHLAGEMRLEFYDDEIAVKFESLVGDPWASWFRLRYSMADYWTGEELEIDDKIYLATTRPHFGGLRWWFICPRSNRRVRKLYLPLGGRHFWSRRTYRLAYASQREAVHDRALRRAHKLCARLGGDPADDRYPDKPKGMRWSTYKRLMDKLAAAVRNCVMSSFWPFATDASALTLRPLSGHCGNRPTTGKSRVRRD